MTIKFPNHFTCTSRTAHITSPTPMDLTSLAAPGLPEWLSSQLHPTQALVTAAEATSTLNPHQSVNFREVLVKVPVTHQGNHYLFPLITYVTDEYSLIRGYLLGFHKKLRPTMEANRLGALDLSGEPDPHRQATTPHLQSLPLMVWTDYATPTAAAHGPALLDVSNREEHSRIHVDPHHSTVELVGHIANINTMYEIRDQFTVTGITHLKEEENR